MISALDHDVYIHPQLRVHQGGGSSGGDHLVVRRSAQREKILLGMHQTTRVTFSTTDVFNQCDLYRICLYRTKEFVIIVFP